jgi:hypothetical protein
VHRGPSQPQSKQPRGIKPVAKAGGRSGSKSAVTSEDDDDKATLKLPGRNLTQARDDGLDATYKVPPRGGFRKKPPRKASGGEWDHELYY